MNGEIKGAFEISHNLPQVQGLTLRGFQGDSDYAIIAALISGCKDADQIERVDSKEDVRRYYSHLINCDLSRDMLFVEMEGQAVGYSRVTWWIETDGPQIYRSLAFLLPD